VPHRDRQRDLRWAAYDACVEATVESALKQL